MHRIPIEIFREHILPYTYNPQPIALCEDIRSYVLTKNTLVDLYECNYPTIKSNIDILCMVIDDYVCEYVCTRFIHKRIKSLFMMKDNCIYDSLKYYYNLRKRITRTEINIKLAILHIYQRRRLLMHCMIKQEDLEPVR